MFDIQYCMSVNRNFAQHLFSGDGARRALGICLPLGFTELEYSPDGSIYQMSRSGAIKRRLRFLGKTRMLLTGHSMSIKCECDKAPFAS